MPSSWRYPLNAWYVLATSDEVADRPLGRRAVDIPIVLYRTPAGAVVALEDRCAHRPYPLSLGQVDGDTIVSGYTGFVYGPNGDCVRVPTQEQVPFGARVRAFPAHDDGTLVWVWTGEAAMAPLRPAPRTGWLNDQRWATFGQAWETEASALLLHENFADITHVAVVDPFIAPPVLRGAPPPLQVEVSETSVSFWRSYQAAPVAPWHAAALDRPADQVYEQRESGSFVSPGLWVDAWDVMLDDSVATFRFTHAVTPIGPTRTRHVWRVSRNFALDEATTATLEPIFSEYYLRVRQILQTMQTVLDTDGPRVEVNVAADVAALQVRKIMSRLVLDEGTGRTPRITGGRPQSSVPARR